MVNAIRLYIEGGGDGNATKSLIREGFARFFGEIVNAARSMRIGWYITVCGGRGQTYDAFCSNIGKYPDSFYVLIVDSEGAFTGNVWQYLQQRDGWQRPEGVTDDQCYLMVQNMETWFVADVEALRSYYGREFNSNPLPRTQHLEGVDRHQIGRALKEATRRTQKGEYHKIQHGSALLARINPARVRAALPQCDRIFTTLLQKMSE